MRASGARSRAASLRVAGVLWLALAAAWVAEAAAGTPPVAAVASAHPLATEAGHEILAQGGNAFDAAVAVSAVLAVVEPYSSGLGGGGFWLLHRARDGLEVMVDARERAPLAARRDMYLDPAGEVLPRASIDGPLAAGVPGVVAAWVHIAEGYGRLALASSLAPAIRSAKQGFQVDAPYRRLARLRLDALRASPAAAATFLSDGEVPSQRAQLRQGDLAATLARVSRDGRKGFYGGETAQALVDGVRSAGGIWTLADLNQYQVIEREPVRGRYRGMHITSASPPSSGGVALVEMLNVLAPYALGELGAVPRTHLIVEAMRRAYRDRAQYLGDPDFVEPPVGLLTHPYYAAGLRATIRRDRATPSASLAGIGGSGAGGPHTTHFSILDREGNRVAATLSINYPFGSGFVPPGTGVLLNDEMDDFVAKPGVPNVYGLVGAQANAIAPGKRMLSSMTPTFLDDGSRLAVLGTPGGSRIITMVLLATLAFTEGATAEAMVARARFHHQYLPDELQLEPQALDDETLAGLEALGHRAHRLERAWGNMQVIVWDRDRGEVQAASDPRGIGAARVH
jgi:gamma-glutamyltranspeptidase/glutathione hydrolase